MKPLRYVRAGQLYLYIGIIFCIALRPQGLAANGGITYYGRYLDTFIPFAVGLLGAAYCCFLAACALQSIELHPMRLALFSLAPLLVLIAATSFAATGLIHWLHVTFGASLFIMQGMLSLWLAFRFRFAFWVVTLCLIELVSGILCAMYVPTLHGFLIQSQVAYQLAFGAVLTVGLRKLMPHELAAHRENRLA